MQFPCDLAYAFYIFKLLRCTRLCFMTQVVYLVHLKLSTVHLKMKCILLLSMVFYKCQIDKLDDSTINVFYVLLILCLLAILPAKMKILVSPTIIVGLSCAPYFCLFASCFGVISKITSISFVLLL